MAQNFLDILREAFSFGLKDIDDREEELSSTKSNRKAQELLDTPTKFLNNLRAATSDDMLELTTRGRRGIRSGEIEDRTKYQQGIPISYRKWNGDEGRMIMYTPSYDKKIVLGFETDGRSMTAEGGLNLLKGIVEDGGSISVTNNRYNKQLKGFPQKWYTPDVIRDSLKINRGL